MEEGPKVHSTTSKSSKHGRRSSSKTREHRKRGSSKKRHEGEGADTSLENINDVGKEQTSEQPQQQQQQSTVTINIEHESKLTRSPAQRSNRSRASSEKSPKHKRSKSESRRRRERKLQAAGEMEVRQANETLMRYLKQCSDLNDASGSLSGDLEISENLDDRKVHRKTKSQREKKSFRLIGKFIFMILNSIYHIHNVCIGKTPQNDLTTILNELNDDIVQNEIYNPFTPVVSPTSEQHSQIVDKIFVQTSSGYRSVDNNSYFKNPSIGGDTDSNKLVFSKTQKINCFFLNFYDIFFMKLLNQKCCTTIVCRSENLD
jgi:hypothetical protein